MATQSLLDWATGVPGLLTAEFKRSDLRQASIAAKPTQAEAQRSRRGREEADDPELFDATAFVRVLAPTIAALRYPGLGDESIHRLVLGHLWLLPKVEDAAWVQMHAVALCEEGIRYCAATRIQVEFRRREHTQRFRMWRAAARVLQRMARRRLLRLRLAATRRAAMERHLMVQHEKVRTAP